MLWPAVLVNPGLSKYQFLDRTRSIAIRCVNATQAGTSADLCYLALPFLLDSLQFLPLTQVFHCFDYSLVSW